MASSYDNSCTLKAVPQKGNITNCAKYFLLDQDGNIAIYLKLGEQKTAHCNNVLYFFLQGTDKWHITLCLK